MPFDFLCCVRPGVEDVVELDYSHQSLSDVPSEVFVYERTLETLLCQSNRITELPRQLFMCHGLKHLDLSDNELQSIPTAISSLVNLQLFNINRNTLSTLPDSMKALKYLLFLDLSVNPLEKLPEAVTNLIALHELYLNDTYLEYLPGTFGRLSNLRILELRDNYLMILPKSLSRSTELLRLDIGQNEFQQFPEVIGRFLKLKELWIDSNSLTTLPSIIKPLENLVHLEASNNMIEDIAPEIGNCKRLVDISLSSNSLTELPDSIGLLNNLTTLKLDNNRLYLLPESIGQLSNLEELMLMCNYLEKLPSSIGLLRKLQYLNIDDNMLRAIPPEIGSCSKLTVLSLRSNKITKIPPEIGHLSSLKVLNLVRNVLSYLPQSLLNCDKLVALWLSENQSKPLVPMHSEVDPQTYEQILTCFLFPQVPFTPSEIKYDPEKQDNNETTNTSKHITFMDLKATTKVPEKPGQLRRAPTPYPKELRALAKHAKNIHKDGTQDVSPPMQSTVHIKAAKITPTFQQRFASDNHKDVMNEVQDPMKVSVYDNLPTDNTYDRPLDLTYEPSKTYKSVDHALYPESNVDIEIMKSDNLNCIPSIEHPIGKSSEDYVQNDERHNYYGDSDNESKKYTGHSHVHNLKLNLQHRHGKSETNVNPKYDKPDFDMGPMINNLPLYNHLYNRSSTGHPIPESNYRESVYEGYSHSKDKIYNQHNFDPYNYHPNATRSLSSPRVPTVSEVVSSSTIPNLNTYKSYPESNVENNHYGPHEQTSNPNANVYDNMTSTSPTYISTQSPELYSPTGHTNATNPYRMTNTPLISDDGSYGHVPSPSSQNVYDIYDAMPTSSNPVISHRHSPSNISEPIYSRGQPPPYHIAAPYTKHAQYFKMQGNIPKSYSPYNH